jgi:carboxymethylenebutenolidase
MTRASLGRRALLVGMRSIAAVALTGATRFSASAQDARRPAPIAEAVQIAGVTGLSGLLVRPAVAGARPAVIVAHGEHGLDAQAMDIARQLGAQGFLALAVDYLSAEGGTPVESGQAAKAMQTLGFTNTLERSRAAFAWLKQRPDCNGRIGAIGFGWGGGVVNDLAVIEPGLVAAVSYYGPQANYFLGLEYKDMKAAMMLHYAGRDRAINVGIAQYDGILRNEATIPAPEIYIYTGVDHGFADQADAAHYEKQAADLAWSRSVGFLRKYLG